MVRQTPPTNQNILQVTRILAVNSFDLSPHFSIIEDVHNAWEFVYIDGGEVTYLAEERSGSLTQGELIFHRPGELHSTICNGKRGATTFNVIFDCPYDSMQFFAERIFRVTGNLLPLLGRLIEECNRTFHICRYPLTLRDDAPMGGEQLIRLYLEEFLLLMMRAEATETTRSLLAASCVQSTLTEDICRFLADHVYDRVNLKMLTEHFHFGKSYLCENFKKDTGRSILNYYTDLKIAEAKKMLREDSLSVSRISEKLGFESPEYFSRCFRKRTGYSPQTFRNMLVTVTQLRRN